MRKKVWFILLSLALCFSLTAAVACTGNGGGGTTPPPEEEEKPVYEGDMLYNGFDSIDNLYKVTQLYTWNYGPLGKLEIVGAENFIPPVDTTETEEAAAAVMQMIDALPAADDVTEFSVAAKDAAAKARSAYGDLTDEAKRLVTNLEKLETLEACDALSGYCTLAELGAPALSGASEWSVSRGELQDVSQGTIIFTVSGIAANRDGALYLSLFHDDTGKDGNGTAMPNEPGNGISLWLRTNNNTLLPQNTTNSGIAFETDGEGNPKTISPDETYTFYVRYNVADSKDSVTVSVRIEDETGDVIADADIENIAELQPTHFGNGGKVSVLDWLSGENRNGFLINVGYSAAAADPVKVNVSNAWTATDAADFAPPAPEEEDPHDPNDLAPRQGDGALRVYYEQGPFTEILARFDRSSLSGLPVGDLGGFSVKVYNDSAETKRVTLGLMQRQNVAVPVDDAEFTLDPYAWTECKVTLNPYIVDALTSELIGLTLRFEDTYDSVYYVDELRVQFGQTYTDEQRETMEKVDALVASIESELGGNVTTGDSEKLETLYGRYTELPVDWRFMVDNSGELFDAIETYLRLRSEESEAGGETSGLLFDEPLGLTQLGSFSGAAASYSTDVAYGSDAGSLRLDFDGTATHVTIPVTPVRNDGYEEVHIWVNNASDLDRAFYLSNGWAVADSAIGDKVTGGNLNGGYVLPANSGWIELIYNGSKFTQSGITEIISVSLRNNSATASVGTLYIGRMVYVVRADYVAAQIDALPEYPTDGSTYPAESRAAVEAARAAYNALSDADKAKVTNLDKLINIEAEIWCEGFAALPETPALMTEYTEAYAQAIAALRESYNALDAVTKTTVTEEEALLQQFETKLNELFAEMGVENVIGMIDRLPAYPDSGTYPAESRAAVTAARAAYNLLSAEDKEQVTNIAKLVGIEAGIWREGFAALPDTVDELNGYSADWQTWSAAVAALRTSYDALDAAVKEQVTADKARLDEYEAAVTAVEEILGGIDGLEEDIAALANTGITAASKSALEGLYTQYIALDANYRALVENADAFNMAVSQYLAAVSVPNADGETTVLHFDELLGQTQSNGFTGGSISYTTETAYADDSGSLEVNFDGTVNTWVTVPIRPVSVVAYDEVHIWVNNSSENKLAFQINWTVADAAAGESVTDGNIVGGYVVPANSGWIELIYNKQISGISEFNITSLDANNSPIVTAGTLYIGKMVLVSYADKVEAQIAALPDYTEGYTAENKELVTAARAAYNELSAENKAQVANVSRLINIEAEIWREGFSALPATPAEMTEYTEAYAQAVSALRESYNALDAAVQTLVADDEALLAEYEAKLDELLAAVRVEHVNTLIADLPAYTSDYSEENRAAVAEARAQYELLTDEQKGQIEEEVLAKLEGLEADIWSGDVTAFKAQVDVAQTYSEDLETQAAALRASYNAMSATVQANEKVVAALTQLGEADTKIASLKTVHEQHVADAAQLVEEIGALGAITAESKEMLEDLYSRYNDLPEAYRAEVTNYTALQTAIGTYLTAISQPNENGESTVLHFDELLGQTQVGSVNGGTSSYTTEVKYGDEAGSLEVAFEGTMPWAEVNLQDISCATADEIHLWVYNGTENRYIVAVNWVTGSVYSPEGSFLSEGAVIPANCGWVEVVITQPTVTTVNQLNITSIDAEGGAIDTVGTLYIGRMVFVNNSSRIESLLKVLVDKEANAYTAADIAAIKEARSVYNSLSPEEQSAVDASLVQTLEACEADIATYYTLSDLTALQTGTQAYSFDLSGGNAVLPGWGGGAANLKDAMQGTVVFKASGINNTAGGIYISLFHDGSKNPNESGAGVMSLLSSTDHWQVPTGAVAFNSGKTITEDGVYTFYVSYKVEQDYSMLSLSYRIEDETGDMVVSVDSTVESFTPSGFEAQTIAQWLRDDANAANHQTFYINGGASTSVTVSDAW